MVIESLFPKKTLERLFRSGVMACMTIEDPRHAIPAPYAHLGVRLLPLGGINLNNMAGYLQEKMVLAVGGSWIVTHELLRTENWSAITVAARAASNIVAEVHQNITLRAG